MEQELIGTPTDVAVLVVYFVAVVMFGMYFGKYATTTKDFFFGGQRFSWWLISFSCIATAIGSQSFIKYSEAGYQYGISSTQSYLNDWFWIPILLFLWLPIIYFMRIQSIPEYFDRRFGAPARIASLCVIQLYLISYVGINLFTLGTALHTLIGWPTIIGAGVAGFAITGYVLSGGQTSVIMTDLVQGVTLMLVGLGIFFFGVMHFGGFTEFWALLPQTHKYSFSEFANPPKFSFIGIYMQDGIANTGAVILMNQGMIMRFLSMRSVRDARKMAFFWLIVLFPLAAITVSGGGWIARALVENGEMSFEGHQARDAFILAADFLCQPGVFGLILAALMAALMSSADNFISAVSAIFVNDLYRPYIKKNREDKHYLKVARITSLSVAALGIALVPLYERFSTVYESHAFITAAIPPPVVTAILLGLLWKRFNLPGAMACIVGGGTLTAMSMVAPFSNWFLEPLTFGMGPDSYTYMRALFSLIASATCGITVAALTKAQDPATLTGLINGTQLDAMYKFKGGIPNRTDGKAAYHNVQEDPELEGKGIVLVPASAIELMAAENGDILYVCDRRWWFGGLRSIHTRLGGVSPDDTIHVSPSAMADGHFRPNEAVWSEKIF